MSLFRAESLVRLTACLSAGFLLHCAQAATGTLDDGGPGAAPDLPPPIVRPTTPDWWGEKIVAPADEWTWIDFPGTHCGDGSPTGLAINVSPAEHPTGLFIYMEGGGACWTQDTCQRGVEGEISFRSLALHMGGYDRETWEGLWGTYRVTTVFQRDREDNPWRDAHFVFVPYCTGDVHSGDSISTLTDEETGATSTFYFKGHDNMRQFLERLVPTFHDVDRVWLTGSSAGGFGASLNWFRAAAMFEGTRVDVLADSGQPIEPEPGLFQTWRETWNLVLPPGCDDCDQGITPIIDYALRTRVASGARYGLITYTRDAIISAFFGIGVSQHEASIEALLADYIENPEFPADLRSRARYFGIDGIAHTRLILGYSAEDDPALAGWLADFANDAPGWSNMMDGEVVPDP